MLACTGVRWGSLCRVGVGLGVGCGGVRLLAAMGEGCAHICSHGQKSVRTQLAGLRVRNNGANEDTRRQRGPRHKREPNQRAWVGGLLTPDGCIEEVTVPGVVTCYLPAAFTAFTSPGSGIVLVWVVGGVLGWVVVLVSSVVAGVRTWWRHGVCVWGGVKRQRSGTPSWGERVCVCGTHRGWCGVLGLVTKGGAE